MRTIAGVVAGVVAAVARGSAAAASTVVGSSAVASAVVVTTLIASVAVASAEPPEVRVVHPARRGDLLVAGVTTAHLPGASIESSLGSGLPSAIEVHFVVRDERNRRIGENRVFLRVAYDLWDEVFHVEGAGTNQRFPDLASLREFLTSLPHVAVAPLSTLDETRRHRIRVDCRLHPIAPRETRRLESWVTGSPTSDRGRDGREVSVGLGDLIRFFYKGAGRDEAVTEGRFSPWFLPSELEVVRE